MTVTTATPASPLMQPLQPQPVGQQNVSVNDLMAFLRFAESEDFHYPTSKSSRSRMSLAPSSNSSHLRPRAPSINSTHSNRRNRASSISSSHHQSQQQQLQRHRSNSSKKRTTLLPTDKQQRKSIDGQETSRRSMDSSRWYENNNDTIQSRRSNRSHHRVHVRSVFGSAVTPNPNSKPLVGAGDPTVPSQQQYPPHEPSQAELLLAEWMGEDWWGGSGFAGDPSLHNNLHTAGSGKNEKEANVVITPPAPSFTFTLTTLTRKSSGRSRSSSVHPYPSPASVCSSSVAYNNVSPSSTLQRQQQATKTSATPTTSDEDQTDLPSIADLASPFNVNPNFQMDDAASIANTTLERRRRRSRSLGSVSRRRRSRSRSIGPSLKSVGPPVPPKDEKWGFHVHQVQQQFFLQQQEHQQQMHYDQFHGQYALGQQQHQQMQQMQMSTGLAQVYPVPAPEPLAVAQEHQAEPSSFLSNLLSYLPCFSSNNQQDEQDPSEDPTFIPLSYPFTPPKNPMWIAPASSRYVGGKLWSGRTLTPAERFARRMSPPSMPLENMVDDHGLETVRLTLTPRMIRGGVGIWMEEEMMSTGREGKMGRRRGSEGSFALFGERERLEMENASVVSGASRRRADVGKFDDDEVVFGAYSSSGLGDVNNQQQAQAPMSMSRELSSTPATAGVTPPPSVAQPHFINKASTPLPHQTTPLPPPASNSPSHQTVISPLPLSPSTTLNNYPSHPGTVETPVSDEEVVILETGSEITVEERSASFAGSREEEEQGAWKGWGYGYDDDEEVVEVDVASVMNGYF
ncbi:hypothetical protein HDU97_004341 [Phlyctochytrium planicorne]|nr:hypothetical protein HDU97_004341 [Phlyctochytrium planicorne]